VKQALTTGKITGGRSVKLITHRRLTQRRRR
jgi:hypothetical protein